MERGKLLAGLAKATYEENSSSYKKNKNVEIKKSHNVKMKDKALGIPDYVQLFDKGKWDELQDYLKLNIKKNPNDIRSTSIKNPEERRRGVAVNYCRLGKEEKLQKRIIEDAVHVQSADGNPQNTDTLEEPQYEAENPNDICSKLFQNPEEGRRAVAVNNCRLGKEEKLQKIIIEDAVHVQSGDGNPQNTDTLEEPQCEAENPNDICSKLFQNPEEGRRGVAVNDCRLGKEEKLQKIIIEDAVHVQSADGNPQNIDTLEEPQCEAENPNDICSKLFQNPEEGRRGVAVNDCRLGKEEKLQKIIIEDAVHVQSADGNPQNIDTLEEPQCEAENPNDICSKLFQNPEEGRRGVAVNDCRLGKEEKLQKIIIEDAVHVQSADGNPQNIDKLEEPQCEAENPNDICSKLFQNVEEGRRGPALNDCGRAKEETIPKGMIEDAVHAESADRNTVTLEETECEANHIMVFTLSPTGELIPVPSLDYNTRLLNTERVTNMCGTSMANNEKFEEITPTSRKTDRPTSEPCVATCNEEMDASFKKRKSDWLNVPSEHGKTKLQKRSWDRKNFCLFCRQLVTNFSRHILRWHCTEKEVLEYLSIDDPNLKERKLKRQKITDDLRNRGNFIFNSSKSIEEDFLPSRRSLKISNPLKVPTTFDYRTCRFCLNMFKKKTFNIHVKHCIKKVTDSNNATPDPDSMVDVYKTVFGSKEREYVLKRDGILILPDVEGASELLKKNILPILNREVDEIALIATNDPLILSIGSLFLYSHQDKKDYYNVTKKLRDAAKLLKTCRDKDSEIKSLSDCFKPTKFLTVIEAVQDLCGFEPETGYVSVVGMPARLSYIIKEGAKLVSCNAIMNNELTTEKKDQIKTEISEFLMLFELRWKYMVSSNAEKTRKKLNSIKPKSLPVDDDVKTLASKLKEYELELYNSLSLSVSADDYESLCKVTIAHIIILNRRRPGEVSRAELKFYLNRVPNDELTSDVLGTLSEEEKLTLSQLTVFMVPGKLVHSVPILLTDQMKKNIDLLISCRNRLNISHSNPLLFPRVSTDNPFDGSKIIREFREKIPLRNKENMTATGLRHHLATKSQINGSETLTENVCQFLGHSSAVHKKNYRIPLQAIQRGQIGHRLLQMESSSLTHSLEGNPEDYDNPINSDSYENQSLQCDISDVTIDAPTSSSPISPSAFTQDWHGDETSSDDSDSYQHQSTNKKRSVCARRRWSNEEKDAVLKYLGSFVQSKKNPGKHKCLELIMKEKCLSGRSWSQVNVLINNFIKGKTKLPYTYQHLSSY